MNSNVQDKMLEYIRQNRVSTTEIADCLGKTGLLKNAYPINRGLFKAGFIQYVYTSYESNWELHEQIQNIDGKNKIIFVDCFECGERAIAGELVSKYLLLYCGVTAIVTNGKMRDAHRLIKENYPIWCNGVSPIGCFNKKSEKVYDKEVLEKRRVMYQDAIAVCDDSGVVAIPRENQTEEFYKKLEWIEEQEDIWFDCIDRRKWNTFQTVCLKAYKGDSQ